MLRSIRGLATAPAVRSITRNRFFHQKPLTISYAAQLLQVASEMPSFLQSNNTCWYSATSLFIHANKVPAKIAKLSCLEKPKGFTQESGLQQHFETFGFRPLSEIREIDELHHYLKKHGPLITFLDTNHPSAVHIMNVVGIYERQVLLLDNTYDDRKTSGKEYILSLGFPEFQRAIPYRHVISSEGDFEVTERMAHISPFYYLPGLVHQLNRQEIDVAFTVSNTR